MTGRVLLLAQRITPMLLKVQPTGRERLHPQDFERLCQVLHGISNCEIEEVAALVRPLLAKRRLEVRGAPRVSPKYRKNHRAVPMKMVELKNGRESSAGKAAKGEGGGVFETLYLLVTLAELSTANDKRAADRGPLFSLVS